MLEVDLHSHTLFSPCGLHTAVEMLEKAKAVGIKALAITDHGHAVGGRLNSVFFERLKEPVPGIRLLKGMECNVLDNEGSTDCLVKFLKYMDIVLIGFHDNIVKNQGVAINTEIFINVMEKNNFIDILTHPHASDFEFDFRALSLAAKKHDVALELNNSRIKLNRSSIESTENMLLACKESGCLIAVNSDAHALNEIGSDDSAASFLEKTDFPDELIINRNLKTAMEFIERKKKYKMMYREESIP